MRTSNRVIWENSMRLLEFIGERGAKTRDHAAVLSYRQMSDAVGLSVQQVRFLCVRLEKGGMLVISSRFAPDGGQLANGYTLTSRGRMALREVRV